jgi:curli biogenesis system outer membrane secretion channel CsgG
MKNSLILLLVFGFVFFCFAGPAQAKMRVAVIPFDHTTQHGGWHVYWSWDDISDGVTEMFTTALFKTGKYSVIERDKLSKVLEEQNLGTSGTINPTTAARVGKVLGVDAIITGKITEFGIKKSNVSAHGIPLGDHWVGGGVKTTEVKAALDVRVINTSTAEIMAAETAEDHQSTSGLDASFDWTSVDFGSSGFDGTLLGKATRNAVNKIIEKMVGGVALSGKIAYVSGNTVKINLGKDSGFSAGTILEVIREGEAVTDPDTGEVLEKTQQKIGEIKIIEVKEKTSDAEIISGVGQITKGDLVRLKK